MDAGLAIYSSHLPLDIHPELGNNILLARAIGILNPEPFFDQKGVSIGLRGSWAGTRQDLADQLQAALGGPVHVCPAGPEAISKIGIITGGAGGEVVKVAASGVDSFITGEGPHWSYPLAEELDLNVFYGGHYATETSGVKGIAERIAKLFAIPWKFHDHPTGL
jgi:putative NIF3 family GTP cyclohydrolase 1 type 2